MKKTHTFALAGAVASALVACCLVVACSKVESKNLPPLPNELTVANVPGSVKEKDNLWQTVASSLEIGNNSAASAADLVTQLATPSTLISNASKSATLAAGLAATYVPQAMATRCAKIKSVTPTGGAENAGATLYVMIYNLSNGNGDNDGVDRVGFVSIPTTASGTAAIVLYAHGGDSGLTSDELTLATGGFASSHIVVAPTLPGQRLTLKSGVSMSTSSTSQTIIPFLSDADELLGMHDCVVRATYAASGALLPGLGLGTNNGTYDGTVNAALANGVLRNLNTTTPISPTTIIRLTDATAVGGYFALMPSLLVKLATGTISQSELTTLKGMMIGVAPITVVAGMSTGGLVAELAMAKSGAVASAMVSDDSSVQTLKSKGYLAPSLFTCAFTASAPYTWTAGNYRLILEYLVRGSVGSTAFAQIPYVESIESYLSGKTASDIVTYFKQIDGTMNGALAIGATQNWANYVSTGGHPTGKGAWFMFHGTTDSVAPIGLMQLGFNIFAQQSAALVAAGLAPGVNLLGLTVAAGHVGVDPTFLTAKATAPADFATYNSAMKKDVENKSLTDALRYWREEGDCATAMAP